MIPNLLMFNVSLSGGKGIMRLFKMAASCLLTVVLLLALVACNQTEFKTSAHFVEASDLAGLMKDPLAVVIDARPADTYAKGHLQNAISLPPDLLSVNEPVSGLIASKAQVENVLGKLGINNNAKVYIYDNNGGVSAGRVWWVLKAYGHEAVKVVNNGESAILKAKLPVSADVPAAKSATYTAKALDDSMYASQDEVKDVVNGNKKAVLLDVRSAAEFAEGAIPKAVLYPHTRNLYSDGTFKSSRDTWLDYHDLGLKRDDSIILYCKTSYRATQTMMVLKEAGFTNVQIYDGAWVEWSVGNQPAAKPADAAKPTKQDAS